MKRIVATFLVALVITATHAQTYSVGHRSVNFKDAARTGGFSISGGTTVPTGGTGRNVGTEIYYPATSAGDNTPFSPGVFPLVIIGHGFAMGWDSYKTLTDSLVKNGYIVALPRTEGSLLPAPSHLDFGKDLAKVAELIEATGSPFIGKLNGRAAIGGHSMGGGATFLSDAFAPANVKCYFTFAAAETNPKASTAAKAITRPHLVIAGTYDCVAPPAQHQDLMWDSLLLSTCKTYINITKAYHCAFADNNLNCGFGEGTCITAGGLSSAAQQGIVRMYLNPYLDYYLKQICPAWTKFNNLIDTATISTVEQVCNVTVPENAAITGDNFFCNGSSTTLSAAPSGFVYTWNDNSTGATLSASSAGTYSLVVGNGTCLLPSVSVSVTENFPPFLPSSIIGSDTVCSGISNINLSVDNQNGVTFNWTLPNGWSVNSGSGSNAIVATSGNAGGQISVTAQNDCGTTSSSQKAIVVVPSNLGTPAAIVGTNSVCPGASVWYSIPAVSGADTYNWTLPQGWSGAPLDSNAILVNTGNTGGALNVVAINGCGNSSPAIQSITINPLPAVSAINGTANVCEGSGAGIYYAAITTSVDSFVWSIPSDWSFVGPNPNSATPIVNVNSTGNIVLNVFNACGTAQFQQAIAVVDTPQPVAIVQGNGVACTSTAVSYQWYFNGNLLPNETGQSIAVVTSSGNYSVVVSDVNGCYGTSQPVNFTIIGLEDVNASNGFTVYPNPVSGAGSLLIKCNEMQVGKMLSITDMSGKILHSQSIQSVNFECSGLNLSAGLYLVKAGNSIQKLVVE
jgi:dienelactone hydrolase